MKKFHVLTHLDEKWPLALDFDQKVKVWLFSVQSNFDQLTEKIYLSIQCNWDLLNLVIRSRWLHWVLESIIEPNLPLARWKIRNCFSSVKTLKMTILRFWWSDQISWGVVVQTWSNGSYELIMLMWIKHYEVWL